MSKRLRWKKQPSPTGLSAVGARPRSSDLHDGTQEYATVSPLGGGWHGPVKGWYFVVNSDVVGVYKNTCNAPVSDEEKAKAQAMAFVKERLSIMAKETP